MDPLNYLTTYSTAFGAPETIFLIAHVALVLAGIYYAFIASSNDTLRGDTGNDLAHQGHFFRMQKQIVGRLQFRFHVVQCLAEHADFIAPIQCETTG